MAQFDRSLGWVAFDTETSYGTAEDSPVYQHGISVSPTYNEARPIPQTLGSNSAHVGRRINTHWSGSVTLGHSDEADDLEILYAHFGTDASVAHTWVIGSTIENDSLTLLYDLNGVVFTVNGCIGSGITWNLANNDYSTCVVDLIGRAPTRGDSSGSPTLPPASELVVPGDLGTFTVGGTAIAGIMGATISYTRQITGMDRQRLGSAVLPQPIIYGRPTITATFNLELDDTTGNDTVAEIDEMLANNLVGEAQAGTAGTIVLDNFTLTGCQMLGDLPELSRGLAPFTFRVAATGLSVTVA